MMEGGAGARCARYHAFERQGWIPMLGQGLEEAVGVDF
jgi:hypothetical protein